MNRPAFTLLLIASLSASTVLAQAPQTDTTTQSTIPEGVVPTPAQTHNPKILGFGMLIVGATMAFILFGRRAKSPKQPGDDAQ